ncbi:MAG: radical SAM protein [Lachnospiraceae bacterium]|nr:radical SAM protein [Lachnospiraceae bacterium]
MSSIKDRLIEKAARAHRPIMSAFELLPVCNLKCKMCYVRKSMEDVRKEGGIKDAKWWLSVAKDAADCGLLYPLLTGGEPFLHPEFKEILSGMLKMGLQVSINSNGTLIDRKWAEFLSKNCPTRINITLYGASEETYRNLCGDGGAFRRVREAVELLKEYGIPFKFNASITPDNVQDIEKMIAYAKEQDAPIQVATYMFPPIRRDSSMVGQNSRLSPDEAALARVLADYAQTNPDWFIAQAERYQRFVPLEEEPWKMGQTGEKGMRCRAGLCSLWVDWQGNFMNCGMYGSVKTNLEGKTFKEAWDEVVEQTANVRYAPDCLSCPNEPLCHPCIAMINNECGSHSGRPEYMCQMNASLAKYYDQFVREHYPDRISNIVITQDEFEDSCEI